MAKARQPHGPAMTLGNVGALGVQRLLCPVLTPIACTRSRSTYHIATLILPYRRSRRVCDAAGVLAN